MKLNYGPFGIWKFVITDKTYFSTYHPRYFFCFDNSYTVIQRDTIIIIF